MSIYSHNQKQQFYRKYTLYILILILFLSLIISTVESQENTKDQVNNILHSENEEKSTPYWNYASTAIGSCLLIGCGLLLYWNERKAVQRSKALNEGRSLVVSGITSLQASNEHKLVHVSAKAQSFGEKVIDPTFNIQPESALKLKTIVELYQWEETISTQRSPPTRMPSSGCPPPPPPPPPSNTSESEQMKATYTKVWSETLIKSNCFHKPDAHINPTHKPFKSRASVANTICVGEFRLDPMLVDKLNHYTPVELSPEQIYALPASIRHTFQIYDNYFFQGADPNRPQIGDCRVRFEVVEAGPVTVVAQQVKDTLVPYRTSVGSTIALIEEGVHSPNAMFESAESSATVLTWIMRGLGWLFMAFAWIAITNGNPIFVPFVTDIARIGVTFGSFLVASIFAMSSISLAWMQYRPFISLGLIGIAVGCFLLLKSL
mmetsp:Transcript_9338/g.14121  ORF Transcript_9338/g.14121 Transcript_9338/m.14121 type:complete len:434 (+) Transcript_9338:284-1585(+)